MNSVIKIIGLELNELDVELEFDDITRKNITPRTRSTKAMKLENNLA
ncbi:MAG: hypothetical protein ACFFAU_06575 [Candidatus Hodarchaeota archaeon]